MKAEIIRRDERGRERGREGGREGGKKGERGREGRREREGGKEYLSSALKNSGSCPMHSLFQHNFFSGIINEHPVL